MERIHIYHAEQNHGPVHTGVCFLPEFCRTLPFCHLHRPTLHLVVLENCRGDRDNQLIAVFVMACHRRVVIIW